MGEVRNRFIRVQRNYAAHITPLRPAYLDLTDTLCVKVNPIPIKGAMNTRSIGGYRMPLCEMAEENRVMLRQAVEVLPCGSR